ncbi:hypothetical protein B0O99DRAFT_647664 [Bisporella sp. PMI_857]|nr:hypothetical protein B0O99DRAFT_647664 [Bisporella sp. PMI_857]
MESQINARVERTLEKLQARVKEQEDVLEKLRASSTTIEPQPSSDVKAHLQQLRALKAAYESITPSEPYLPNSDSPIAALLALRVTDTCIKETQACIVSKEGELQKLQKRLGKEQSDLRDAKLIQAGLQDRVASLKRERLERTQKSSSQVAKDTIRELKQKKNRYDTGTGNLVKAFNEFIDEHLAAMLAAEELGGPVVGGILDVDEEMLEAGFSSQGKAKKPSKNVNKDSQQRRIDQIWGPQHNADGDETLEPRSEKDAAGAEVRDLTEQLLNSLVEAEGNGPGQYVELEKESAASRFLVRSKVAQFHPKDATKLRLIDFGAIIDD